ncbi:sugar diacid utilization regulator [Rathayibacter sp. PhB152]|uniref:PucR family transcriptional regulator n=1 Tax=Rathayibacter sp. PhB152 TaxID=2485190 RepID=UPI000F4BDE59|nr:PucR family transcriptional regulator [Rathayibacter sp. PhB152]ROQ60440.1 sugar diacid utilization regulator [Rathayibacter sp. PhB152]
MNVRELLGHPELQLTLVGGDDVQLARAISGTYTIDLPDPGRFLSPGDVVLTSALWTSGRESVERFVGGVADRGVVAIVVGLIAVGSLPEGMLEVCRRHGIALLTVAPDVSFKTIAQTVAGVIAQADLPTLGREARFARRLLADPAPGEGVQVALRAFFEEFAHGSWAVDRAGTLVASAGGLPTAADYGAAWEASLSSPDSRWEVTEHGRSLSRRALFSAAGERLGVLVVTGDQRGWSEETADGVELLAGAVAGRLDLARQRERASAAPLLDLLRALLHDELPESETAVRLRLLGFRLGAPLRVVVARTDDPSLPPEALLQPLHAAAEREHALAVGAVLDGAAVLLLGDPADERSSPGPALRSAVEAAPWLLHERRIAIGVGDASRAVEQLGVSLLAARERASRASSDEPVSIVEHTVPVSSDALLELVAPRTRAAFALTVLGPLVRYDDEHRSDMVETLRVFLESGGSWRQAADRLHLHASTLRYRMQRIEALTGRDLSAMADRVDLHLALRFL